MTNIKLFYKTCVAAMLIFLVLGLLFRFRTFLILFELITAAFAITFVFMTGRDLYLWYSNKTQNKK